MIPGFGIVISFLLLFFTGAIASNVFGKQLGKGMGRHGASHPRGRRHLQSVKQLTDPVLSENGQAFNKAVLIEFPHPGAHSIAFPLTNKVQGELRDKLGLKSTSRSTSPPRPTQPVATCCCCRSPACRSWT